MKIAIASGKGGTGKTTVATNLALALQTIMPVQLLDCDVEAPNAHLFLNPFFDRRENVSIPIPVVNQDGCIHCGECAKICRYHAIAMVGEKVLTFLDLCHGCGGCSLVCPTTAISEQQREIGVTESGHSDGLPFVHGRLNIGSPLSPPIIRAVKSKANPQGMVIIDAPPGTSCPVVTSVEGVDFCILVTEPTRFGLNDLMLAVNLVQTLDIPFGVVINRADEELDSEVDRYCSEEKIPVLLKIPFERKIAELYAAGKCLVQFEPEWRERFRNLGYEIKARAEQCVNY